MRMKSRPQSLAFVTRPFLLFPTIFLSNTTVRFKTASLLIVFAIGSYLLAQSNSESNCVPHVVVSTRVGKRSYRTSIAMISLGLRRTGITTNDVQEEMSKACSKLAEYIKSQKVARLTTTAVNDFPSYDYRSKPRTVTGYTGLHTLSFEVPIDRAGIILDGSVSNSATTISSFSFRASGEVSSHAILYAIRYSIVRARIEARTAAFSLGKVLGNRVYIKVTNSYIPRPVSAPNIAERITNTVLVQYFISPSTCN